MTDKQLEDVAGDGYGESGEDNTQLIPGKSLTGPGFVTAPDGSASSGDSAGSEVSPLQMELGKISKKCHVEGLAVIIISGISFSVAVTFALIITIYYGPPQVAPHGSVVSEAAECSVIGTDILKQGGSAVDAAIATAFCLGLVHPHATGLGAGGYMVVRLHGEKDPGRQMKAYDFMATVPAAMTSLPQGGGPAIGVPGFLKGMKTAHEQYGKLKWEDLIQPTIDLAKTGFNVTKELADAVANLAQEDRERLFDEPYHAGNKIVKQEVAQLLLTLQDDAGVKDFYSGKLADDIISSVRDQQIIEKDDFSNYSVFVTQPITYSFLNVTVATCTTPCSGPLVLAALNIMNNMTWSHLEHNTTMYFHRLIESMKFAHAARLNLKDPQFYPQVKDYIKEILTEEFGHHVRDEMLEDKTLAMEDYFRVMNITMAAAQPTHSVSMDVTPRGASHVSVFGENEDMVTLSLTMGSPFGSKVQTSSGIILNNLLREFSTYERENNEMLMDRPKLEGGVRPVTPLAPLVTFNAKKPCARRVALGVTGNLPGVSGLIQALLGIIGYNEKITDAITETRVHAQPETDTVWLRGDVNTSTSIVSDLEAQGHKVIPSIEDFGKINVAAKINETVQAIADPAGGGVASVY